MQEIEIKALRQNVNVSKLGWLFVLEKYISNGRFLSHEMSILGWFLHSHPFPSWGLRTFAYIYCFASG
jgi:hypothetical protein